MDVRAKIWDILLHVIFLYNFWEFLQFFPELCDIQGPLGGPQGEGGPPHPPSAKKSQFEQKAKGFSKANKHTYRM